ncbi:hypothetical protein C8R46DRAFT_1210675 [Mycena filopes]|nr:hypothetical protein C8R46DRAFT_1210675 [Mycena filopes]
MAHTHTYFTKDDIDFGLLSQYPTDLELSAAYEIAAEENNCLWSLLGIHPMDIANAPDPGQSLIAQPAPDPDFKDLYLHEDDETVEEEERSAAEELQKVVDSLKNVSNITRAGDEELAESGQNFGRGEVRGKIRTKFERLVDGKMRTKFFGQTKSVSDLRQDNQGSSSRVVKGA